MTHDDAFLRDIIDHPEDDTPRLIYADWLDDNDHPERAEFIRLQCERAKLWHVGPRVAECELRERELLDAHGSDWLEPLQLVKDEVRFERGFVTEVKLKPDEFAKRGEELVGKAPITGLLLADIKSSKALSDLPRCAALARLRSLNIEYSPLSLNDFLPIFESPYLRNLESLRLGSMSFDQDSLDVILDVEHFPQLKRFDVGYGDLDEHVVFALNNELLAQLTVLRLDGNDLHNDGLRRLAASDFLGNLRHLGVAFSDSTFVGLRDLLQAKSLKKLEGLNVGCNQIGDRGARLIAQSEKLTGLRELDIGNVGLTPKGAKVLARSPNLRNLITLQIGNEIDSNANRIGNEGLKSLAHSPHLGNLLELDLMDTGINAKGIEELLDSPLLPHLYGLNLSCNALSTRALKRLVSSPSCANLHVLSLDGCGVTEEGIKAIVESPYLGKFTYLGLSKTNLSAKMRRALKKRFGSSWRADLSYEKMREDRNKLV